MQTKDFSFKSATGVCEIHGRQFLPQTQAKAAVAIHHGMAEHMERYADFITYLTSNGVTVFMHDMANHGSSNQNRAELGFFGKKDGWLGLIKDYKTVFECMRKAYPAVKHIAFGHSMGSFVVRCFDARYPELSSASVYMGTGGTNDAAGIGIKVADLIAHTKGAHHRSELMDKLAFGKYNVKFEKRTSYDWLTRDQAIVDQYIADPLCGYLFTIKGMADLLHLNTAANSDEWYEKVRKDLPILLISGAEDPVGEYAKGIDEVYNKLLQSGHTAVEEKLYPECRHEVLNELNKEEVYEDIYSFIMK
ncbi:MAG TPA: alpha/beta hydrolase [Candidatus Eubacterium faecipullorum]|uniref:Alpha/beta hydrolase n=1 Tax=Candidatus Eubacterium faecipullorum TaxID=2838571 RepID=A0A9D1RDR5_9FIRM|nr:alpha/beta hydrolase [Candidatus Eubacterium faecipullorum]